MLHGPITCAARKRTWHTWASQKVKFWLWVVSLDRCRMAVRLARRGINHAPACMFCDHALRWCTIFWWNDLSLSRSGMMSFAGFMELAALLTQSHWRHPARLVAQGQTWSFQDVVEVARAKPAQALGFNQGWGMPLGSWVCTGYACCNPISLGCT